MSLAMTTTRNLETKSHMIEQMESAEVGFEAQALAWCPGLGSVFNDAAKQLGTNALVYLVLARTGPAGVIADELMDGSLPACSVVSTARMASFVTTSECAINLLRAHGKAGGVFVADHMAIRADNHEYWTMSIDKEGLDTSAYSGDRTTFYAASDFGANDVTSEVILVVETRDSLRIGIVA